MIKIWSYLLRNICRSKSNIDISPDFLISDTKYGSSKSTAAYFFRFILIDVLYIYILYLYISVCKYLPVLHFIYSHYFTIFCSDMKAYKNVIFLLILINLILKKEKIFALLKDEVLFILLMNLRDSLSLESSFRYISCDWRFFN